MKKGDKTAIVCCSNGLSVTEREKIEIIRDSLNGFGLPAELSPWLFAGASDGSVCSGTGKQRADSLMSFFNDNEVKAIFDVSGGDIANEILPFLNYEEIKASKAVFCGYSDLTTVMNAIYTKTGKPSLWYQMKHLAGRESRERKREFEDAFLKDENQLYEEGNLFHISCKYLQGEKLKGTVVGGNVRCMLKLAGTPYWPDMNGKILFMEARSGSQAQMIAYLNQLQQMGVFRQIQGILLGTFLQMEKEAQNSDGYLSMPQLVQRYAGADLPILMTSQVGHRSDSRALWIGKEYRFYE